MSQQMGLSFPRKFGAMDADGTIFKWTLLVFIVTALADAGIFPVRVKKVIDDMYDSWRFDKISFTNFIDQAVRLFAENLKGQRVTDVERVANAMVAKEAHYLYIYTRARLRQFLAENRHTAIISQSPDFVVKLFAQALGVPIWSGTIYKHMDGIFTGECVCRDKSAMFDELDALHHFDMSGSVYIGDTFADVCLLERVEYPECFCPDEDLAKEAEKRGWPIIIERKRVPWRYDPTTRVCVRLEIDKKTGLLLPSTP